MLLSDPVGVIIPDRNVAFSTPKLAEVPDDTVSKKAFACWSVSVILTRTPVPLPPFVPTKPNRCAFYDPSLSTIDDANTGV